MSDERGKRRPIWQSAGLILGLALTMACTVGNAAMFLPRQSLWGDEAAQMYGVSLGPRRVIDWLFDPMSVNSTYGDRNPPLSYWLQWGWSCLFGSTERSLRWCGVACSGLAAGLVFGASYRAHGLLPAFAVGLLFAFSPNICYRAVDIRTYPLFLLTSAGAFYALVGVLVSSGRSKAAWVSLTVWLLLAMYTHFFGVMLAGATLVALFFWAVRRREGLLLVLVVGGIVVCCAAGLVPFIQGALSTTVPDEDTRLSSDRTWEVLQLFYRLIYFPTMLIYPVWAVLTLSAAAVLLVLGFFPDREGSLVSEVTRHFLVAGLTVAVLANYLVSTFNAASPFYNTWALPGFFVLLGAGLAAQKEELGKASSSWVRWASFTATVLLLSCEAFASKELWEYGEYYAHSSYQRIQVVLDLLPVSETAVVYESDVDPWMLLYLPVHFAAQGKIHQYVTDESSSSLRRGDRMDVPIPDASQLEAYRYVVLVRTRNQGGRELAYQIRHGDQPLGFGPLLSSLETSGAFQKVRHELFISLIAAEVAVLERREQPR